MFARVRRWAARTRRRSGATRARRRFVRTRSGQSEGIGLVLLLAISVIAATVLVATGAGVVDETRQGAEIERNAQAMTVLDSRASQVALGEQRGREVTLGDAGRGAYEVREDAGWLRVRHHNYTAGSTETVYNVTLGAVVYENGGRTVAYQGGGVWRGGENGSVMVSPPEVHYRDATLTMPVVLVEGDGSAAGQTWASVEERGSEFGRVYPNATTTGSGPGAPYDATGEPYGNPVTDGYVTVTVHSDYYRGWAEFFRTRTEGAVTLDHANETVSVRLVTRGTQGWFDVPPEGQPIEVRGLPPHQLQNFTLVLYPDNLDAARFHNLQWTLHAEQGNREFEIHLRHGGNDDDPSTACKEVSVDATVYYSDANGDPYHGWHAEDVFRTECYERGDDSLVDETRLVANLTGTGQLELQDLQKDDTLYFNTNGATARSSVTLDGHGASWEPATYSTGDRETIDRLLNHYLSEMGPNVDLVVDDKPSDTIHEGPSWGRIEYPASGQIAFLYVTENRVRVELE